MLTPMVDPFVLACSTWLSPVLLLMGAALVVALVGVGVIRMMRS